MFIESILPKGFLSFSPEAEPIKLSPLNVLIGPNGSGKSNLIECFDILRATPTGLASLVREGGTAQEWLWKGEPIADYVSLEVLIKKQNAAPDLRYRLNFASAGQRMEVLDEVVEDAEKQNFSALDVFFYYRFQQGRPVLNIRSESGKYTQRMLKRETLVPDESVLSQRKDPDIYPEVTWLGEQFSSIQIFRNWTFGRSAPLRRPQATDLPTNAMMDHADNLGLMLNELQHSEAGKEFDRLMAIFLPRYERFSTRIQGNTVQFYLHEDGMKSPIPATRLSDGTIRFMAILCHLLSPNPPPLLCIEEPELGLHPDAASLLADVLVEASERMQLIVTTHSDALISALTEQTESVLVCDHVGETRIERLDSDDLAHWLEKYKLGDLWRIGELGGNP